MRTKPYGKTGKQVSVIAFGGMRFEKPDDVGASSDLIRYAHAKGINYFDTAPFYCDDKSEPLFGQVLPHLARDSFFVSTKSAERSGDKLRAQLEHSLTRLRLDYVDFFHIWCLMSLEDWQARKKGGVLEAALRAQEDGLVRHVVCSSHLEGDGLATVLEEGNLAGVTLGYNAINFPYREAAVRKAGSRKLGIVAMNPLSGGLIPKNPERFAFLKQPGDTSVVAGALRFVISDPDLTAALVGFSRIDEVDAAVAVGAEPPSDIDVLRAKLREHIQDSYADVCTGCQYCLPCPEGIPIPQYMDVSTTMRLAGGDPSQALERFKWHWSIQEDYAKRCTECGTCEARCTQHLNIIERLKELPPPAASAAE